MFCCVVLHAVWAGLGGLSVDEAHYALYANHLDWSYFDHPPLVGWIQWPLVALDLSGERTLRLIPQVLWLLTLALALWAVQRFRQASDASGAAALPPARLCAAAVAVLFALSPMLHLLALALVPDTLLMPLALGIMLLGHALAAPLPRVHHSTEVNRNGPTWLLLGLLLGLAGLSKYTAILFAGGLLAYLLLTHAYGRTLGSLLRSPAPWLAIALALVLILPVLFWNMQHDWISFRYQLTHGSGSHWRTSALLRYLLLQLLYGPLFWMGLWEYSRLRWASVRARGLPLLGALPLAVLLGFSGGDSSLPHWTAPAWGCLAPLSAYGLAQGWSAGRKLRMLCLAGIQLLLCLVLFALLAWGAIPGVRQNPLADLYGWQHAAERARMLAHDRGIAQLAVSNWTLASRLAWYARPLPVHVLDKQDTGETRRADDGTSSDPLPAQEGRNIGNIPPEMPSPPAPRVRNQFDLWFGALPRGADVLWLDWSEKPYPLPIGLGQFARCTPLDSEETRRWGRPLARFTFWHCRNWREG